MDIDNHPTHNIDVKMPLLGHEMEQIVVAVNQQIVQRKNEQVSCLSRERRDSRIPQRFGAEGHCSSVELG